MATSVADNKNQWGKHSIFFISGLLLGVLGFLTAQHLNDKSVSPLQITENTVMAPKELMAPEGTRPGTPPLGPQGQRVMKNDQKSFFRYRPGQSANSTVFPDYIIQALQDPAYQTREAALKKLIELDDDSYAKHLEQNIAALLQEENHDDVLISILEYYDYYYFSDPSQIKAIGSQLLSRAELSEDVLMHIVKIWSSYDIPDNLINLLVTASPGFLNLSSLTQETLINEIERILSE